MYRLLIVEDEDIIRSGIKKIIQEMDLPIKDILEASSGEAGLEIAQRESIDLIITDIKMEQGDGLAFIRNLSQAKLHPRTIILSGYGEFAFAQQAISLGVSAYLLKPIKKKNLFEALTTLIEQLDAERNTATNVKSEESAKDRQQRIVAQLIQGRHSPDDIQELLRETGLTFPHRYFIALSFFSGNPAAPPAARSSGQVHPSVSIYGSHRIDGGYTTLLLGTDDATISSNRVSHQTLLNLLLEQGFDVEQSSYLAVSDLNDRLELLPRIIEQSAYALDFRLLRPNVHYFIFKEVTSIDSTASPSMTPNAFTQAIRSALQERNPRAWSDAIDGWFRFIREQRDITPGVIVDTFYNLLVFSEFTSDMEQDWNWRTHNDLIRIYRGSSTLDEFRERLKERFSQIHKRTAARNVPYDSNAISFIIKYLERHYNQDITLRSAAEQIFMNPSYFSTLFKKKTGINFIPYLQKLRIEKSKKLLLNPQYKIYEVATLIGFADEKYFFKVFKSLTGITPNEYRDKRDFD
jgi:two-component system response regulator YesN